MVRQECPSTPFHYPCKAPRQSSRNETKQKTVVDISKTKDKANESEEDTQFGVVWEKMTDVETKYTCGDAVWGRMTDAHSGDTINIRADVEQWLEIAPNVHYEWTKGFLLTDTTVTKAGVATTKANLRGLLFVIADIRCTQYGSL
jgi:hypothetical protein